MGSAWAVPRSYPLQSPGNRPGAARGPPGSRPAAEELLREHEELLCEHEELLWKYEELLSSGRFAPGSRRVRDGFATGSRLVRAWSAPGSHRNRRDSARSDCGKQWGQQWGYASCSLAARGRADFLPGAG